MKTHTRSIFAWLVLALSLAPSASASITIDGLDLETADADDYLQLYEDQLGGDQVFSDVPSDHWAFTYLGSDAPLITSGAVGSDESLYNCNEPATRAETVKIISLLFRVPEQEQSGDTEFDDVDADAWYSLYLNNLVTLGVINGYSDGTFKPEGNVTRAETVKILATLMYDSTGWAGEDPFDSENYAEADHGVSEPESFTDVEEGDWFYTYVDFFSRASLADGYEDQTFRPNENVTRCELAKLTGQSYFVFATTVQIIQGFIESFTGVVSEDLDEMVDHFWQDL